MEANPTPHGSRYLTRFGRIALWCLPRLLLAILVLVAFLAVSGRVALYYLQKNPDWFQAKLSDELGVEIRFEQLRTDWAGLDPIVEFHGLSFRPPSGTAAIPLDFASVQLDAFSSILNARLIFRELLADQLDLTLVRNEQGQLVLSGFELAVNDEAPEVVAPSQISSGIRQWIDRLGEWSSDPRAQLTRFTVTLDLDESEPTRIEVPQLNMIYERGTLHASGRAFQVGTSRQLANFRLEGQHFFRGGFDGQLYLGVDSGRLFDAILREFNWQHLAVNAADVGGRAWLTFGEGKLTRVNARLRTPLLELKASGQSLPPIEDLSLNLGWQSGADRVKSGPTVGEDQWIIKDLSWRFDGETVGPINLAIWENELGSDPVKTLRRAVEYGGGQTAGEMLPATLSDSESVYSDSASESTIVALDDETPTDEKTGIGESAEANAETAEAQPAAESGEALEPTEQMEPTESLKPTEAMAVADSPDERSSPAAPDPGTANVSAVNEPRFERHFWVDQFPLQPILNLMHRLELITGFPGRAIDRYRPRGTLRQVNLVMGPDSDIFRLAAALDDLSIEAFDGAPAMSGLDGQVWVDQHGGQILSNSDQVVWGFPQLFTDLWNVRDLKGQVAFIFDGPILRVFGDSLTMTTDTGGRAVGAFDLRLNEPGPDWLGMKVSVTGGDAEMIGKFVPDKAVDPELYRWLTESIREAKVTNGVYYGHGLVSHSDRGGSFRSSMLFDFEDATVRFDPAWPQMSQAAGRVKVSHQEVDVQLGSGRIGGLDLQPTTVGFIPGESDGTITVATSASGTASNLGFWLQNTPLGTYAGKAGDVLTAEGRFDLGLGLRIPLAEDAETQIDLTVEPKGASVAYPDLGLEWRKISGKLHYRTQHGFSRDALYGRFKGQPVTVRFRRLSGPTEGISIQQVGKTDLASLADAWQLPPAEQFGLAGTLDYDGVLSLPEGAPPSLAGTVDLTGVEVAWPEPLAKHVGAPSRLVANLKWSEGEDVTVEGFWDDTLAYSALLKDGVFSEGHVQLGARETRLMDEPGLVITGPVKRLSVEDWSENIARRLESDATGSSVVATETSVAQGSDASADGEAPVSQTPEATEPSNVATESPVIWEWLTRLSLDVKELLIGPQTISEINLNLNPGPQGWWLDATSEAVKGRIFVPAESQKYVSAEFERLHLAADRNNDDIEASLPFNLDERTESFRELEVAQWPPVEASIQSLKLGERDLGTWKFLMEPEDNAVRVRDISGQLNTLSFTGDLFVGIEDQSLITRVSGDLRGANVADIGPLIGSQVPLESKKSQIAGTLVWPGRPDDFAAASLSGDLTLRLDDGVILQQNNSAQLFRVFNVLNTDTLWRRLQLDFSDLYEAGVAFDAISGKAALEEGILTLKPELQVVGPSGAMKLSGSSNLDLETLDMTLVVVLPLIKNLPLAAVLMGASAPIGGALFVLDKVLGDPLSKLTSATYSVQGTWDEPEVKLDSIFDTSD